MSNNHIISNEETKEALAIGKAVVHTNTSDKTANFEMTIGDLKIEVQVAPAHTIRFSKP